MSHEVVPQILQQAFPTETPVRVHVFLIEPHSRKLREFSMDRLGAARPSVSVWRPLVAGATSVGQVLIEIGGPADPHYYMSLSDRLVETLAEAA